MVKIAALLNKKTWDKFVKSFPEANFLHSFNFGEFHKRLNNSVRHLGFYHARKLVGIMLCIVEDARRSRYLTVPGGPLVDFNSKVLMSAFKRTVQEIAYEEGCSFVRVRPQILATEKNKDLFRRLGFIDAPMHLHAELTRQLDLTKIEAELLSSMRKATRHEIKKAFDLNIQVTTSIDPAEIKGFYKLQIETAKRQGFIPFNLRFLEEQFKVFAQDNQALLYTATFKKSKLAQAIVLFYGIEADYHYGVSSELGRKYPGSYLIQWEAIKEAKRRGMRRYNLWGVAPENDKRHRFYGVSVFKRGFGGEDVKYLHAQDLIIDPKRYAVNWAVEKIRKIMRRV